MENMDLTQLLDLKKENPNPTILIQTFKNSDSCSLIQTLEEVKPGYVIMYHNDMSAVRQIEVSYFDITLLLLLF